MKKTTLFTLSFAVTFALSSTAQDTLYYNAAWKETSRDKSSPFMRIKIKKDQVWQVTDIKRYGKVVMTGAFADDSCHIQEGPFKYYDEKAGIIHLCTYAHGKSDGSEIYYYDSTHKQAEGNNKDGQAEGEWTGYYRSGKISGKAIYKNGKQESAAFFHEDGSPDKTIKDFLKESEYPGGVLRFLNKNLKYPDVAVKNNIQGTVVVHFKVAKDGTPTNFIIVQSVDKSLNNEALRVLRLMSNWEPAMLGGVPVDSYKSQPIVFRF